MVGSAQDFIKENRMDSAKAIWHCGYLRLILFVTCVFIHYSSVQSSESTPAFTRTEKSVWFDRKRVRRSSTCYGNKTVFLDDQRAVNCFYDHACFQFFSDCCSDYTEKCGEQKSNQAQWSASMWKCFETFDPICPCKIGAYVPLSPHEYILFRNLTVYHKATNRTFKFGEYVMSEYFNSRNNDTSNTTQNSKNTTIAVCLLFNTTFMSNETKYTKTTKPFGLQILTIIGFSVSTICHVLLLVTYGLFQELRNVSGLNLMNLSFILCLSQVISLVGTTYFQGTVVCKVFAILLHHLLQASFSAMSVISHHTFHVFSRPFTGRFANTSRPRFIKYSIFVWVTPAVFVAICVTLDETRVFVVEYGTNCWLGTANAKLYLFLLPVAIQLLFNICKFIQTAVSLSRHDKERQALHIKKGKQNLLICMKLATLVGFPWLIAFLGALFPDVEAFAYLIAVFVCLEGLYIAMAFLFTKKILKLYKDRWNNRSRVNTPQTSAKESFGMKAH